MQLVVQKFSKELPFLHAIGSTGHIKKELPALGRGPLKKRNCLPNEFHDGYEEGPLGFCCQPHQGALLHGLLPGAEFSPQILTTGSP